MCCTAVNEPVVVSVSAPPDRQRPISIAPPQFLAEQSHEQSSAPRVKVKNLRRRVDTGSIRRQGLPRSGCRRRRRLSGRDRFLLLHRGGYRSARTEALPVATKPSRLQQPSPRKRPSLAGAGSRPFRNMLAMCCGPCTPSRRACAAARRPPAPLSRPPSRRIRGITERGRSLR